MLATNLETIIAEGLWGAIESHYKANDYTNAIRDGVFYLSDVIRKRTGFASDGVTLVGQAFGGKRPKLKVNKLQTESDWNVQKGIESILRGIYQAIRNPRSHQTYKDSKEDAEAIIIFIDYLLRIIEQSRAPFTVDEFLERVFDPMFPNQKRYAELLVREIPVKQRLELMIELFKRKECDTGQGLKQVPRGILKKLKSSETRELYKIISDELVTTNSTNTMLLTLKMLPADAWLKLDELSRRRVENQLLESLRSGMYDRLEEKCTAGGFGTWTKFGVSLIKRDICVVLLNKLGSDNEEEQDYVFQYFFGALLTILPQEAKYLGSKAKRIINEGLKSGDRRFYDAVGWVMHSEDDFWQTALSDAYESFQEAEPSSIAEDDIPF